MKTWCLVNLAKHEVAKDRRNRFVLRESASHPRDLPAGFSSRDGYVYEELCGEIVDPNHKGAPVYVLPDPNVARVLRIVSSKA